MLSGSILNLARCHDATPSTIHAATAMHFRDALFKAYDKYLLNTLLELISKQQRTMWCIGIRVTGMSNKSLYLLN